MAKEILKDEQLTDEQLDNVAGGTYGETFADMDYLADRLRVYFHGSDSDKRAKLRDLMWKGGIQLKDHGGSTPNQYFVINQQTGEKLYETNREDALRYVVAKLRSQGM